MGRKREWENRILLPHIHRPRSGGGIQGRGKTLVGSESRSQPGADQASEEL